MTDQTPAQSQAIANKLGGELLFGLEVAEVFAPWLPQPVPATFAVADPLLKEGIIAFEAGFPAMVTAFQGFKPLISQLLGMVGHHVAQGMTVDEAKSHVAQKISVIHHWTPDETKSWMDRQNATG